MTSRQDKQKDIRDNALFVLRKTYPRAKNIKGMESGNYSGVFYFENDNRKLIFKMPSHWFPLESELYFYQQASKIGLLVSRVNKADLKAGWMVMEFIDGESKWDDFGKKSCFNLWTDLGRVAKKLHSITTNGVGIYRKGKFTCVSNQEFLTQQIDWLTSNKFFKSQLLNAERIRLLKEAIKFIPKQKSLLHGDLSLNNTIRGEGKVKVLIDPGPWRGGYFGFDLGHIHSQALEYKKVTKEILHAFNKGYGLVVDWEAKVIQFCSLFWDLVVLRFLAENDEKEFNKRLKLQKVNIELRFSRIKF